MLWEICFSLLSTVSAGGVADGDEVLTVHVGVLRVGLLAVGSGVAVLGVLLDLGY